MRPDTRSTVAMILGAASLFAVLLLLVLRSEQVRRETPTLNRAPTARSGHPIATLPA